MVAGQAPLSVSVEAPWLPLLEDKIGVDKFPTRTCTSVEETPETAGRI